MNSIGNYSVIQDATDSRASRQARLTLTKASLSTGGSISEWEQPLGDSEIPRCCDVYVERVTLKGDDFN